MASSVAYQPFGPLASLSYGNGLTLTRTFTEDYLIGTLQVQDPSTLAYVLNRSYGFGDNINLTTITDDRAAPAAPGSVANSYSYPSGNNLLSTITQGATTVRAFSYDGAGNITADTRGSTAYNYSYNNRNRLAELAIGSTVTADYTYDGLERMAIRTTANMTPASTTHYLYDLAGHLLVETDDTGQTLREYVWLDDMPLAVVSDVNTMSPNLYFVHADHLDTPIRMTDASKAVVWDAYFLPFGSVESISGSASNNLRFPGQYFLIEDGLHYNWYRHYDATLGRYVQPDPLGFFGGPSVYAYTRSAPQTLVDQRGLWQITVQGGFGPGARLTIGNNGGSGWFNGQWNLGVYVGYGQGFSFDIDPFDRGCKEPGQNVGIEASAETHIVGVAVAAEAHALGREPWWNIGTTVPGSTGIKGSYGTEGVSFPTFGFGTSGFVGYGWTTFGSR